MQTTPGVSDANPVFVNGQNVGSSFTVDPSRLGSRPVVIVNHANPGAGPTVTTEDALRNAIDDTGHRFRPCGNCRKSPPTNAGFRKCMGCETTHYCSTQCQKAHWPEHKRVCKERQAMKARIKQEEEAARQSGRVYIDPDTLRLWYRRHNAAVEHAAFHVLQLFKGTAASLQPTHVAVFTVEVNAESPNDPSRVLLRGVDAMPRSMLVKLLSPATAAHCESAAREGAMVLFFWDTGNKLMCMEYHIPPPSDPYTRGEKQPDELWKVHTMFKINTSVSASPSAGQ